MAAAREVVLGKSLTGLPVGAVVTIKVKEDIVAPPATLHQGDDGEAMRKLERALAKLAYLAAKDANGVWDLATEVALKKFRADWSLSPDAIYDAGAEASLKKALAGEKPKPKVDPAPATGAPADAVSSPAPLQYAGGHNANGYTDVGGTIYFVKDRPAKTSHWSTIKSKGIRHWKAANDPYLHCVDYSSGDFHEYGPNVEFSIAAAGKADQCGGYLDVKLPNGEVIRCLHFSQISERVYAAKGTGEKLPAGTYLGFTGKKIGLTSGPHLHAQSQSRYHRDCWIEWMTGNLTAPKKKA